MDISAETKLTNAQSRLIATQIREELARRRMSRQLLADQAKISISTLEKALSGRRPFTLATTIRIEEALGLTLRGKSAGSGGGRDAVDGSGAAPINLAPGDLGFYSRP